MNTQQQNTSTVDNRRPQPALTPYVHLLIAALAEQLDRQALDYAFDSAQLRNDPADTPDPFELDATKESLLALLLQFLERGVKAHQLTPQHAAAHFRTPQGV